MIQVRQTDYRLPIEVNKWGCFFRSLLAIAEVYIGRRLRVQEIAQAYREAVAEGMDYMTPDCVCKSESAGGGIINQGIALLGGPGRGFQLGSINPAIGKMQWWGPKGWDKDWGWQILLGKTEYGNSHYRLADREGILIFDPDPTAKVKVESLQLLYVVR